MSITKSLSQIFILGAALVTLAGYQYIGAAWSDPPTGTAPAGNIDIPINVGTTSQIKLGDLTAVNLKAGSQMWSPEYCDELGVNCTDMEDLQTFINLDGNPVIEPPVCTGNNALQWDGSAWNCQEF